MASFSTALNFTLKHEGMKLYVDPLTNERSRWGITQKLLLSLNYHQTDPNLLNPIDIDSIYRKIFWDPNRLSEIENQLIANKVFDMAVNMGSRQAVKLLQASLNSVGGMSVIDGILGPHTVVSINEFLKVPANEERLLSELVLKSVQFYRAIAIGNNAKSLNGWITRAEDIGMGEADKLAFNPLRDGGKDKTIKG